MNLETFQNVAHEAARLAGMAIDAARADTTGVVVCAAVAMVLASLAHLTFRLDPARVRVRPRRPR